MIDQIQFITEDKYENEIGNIKARLHKLENGDLFYTQYRINQPRLKAGQYYLNNEKLLVTKVFYKPKKWWQIFKKKQIIGY